MDTKQLECTEKGRMETYVDWPHKDTEKCNKNRMAKAGFYYQGIDDCVRCFVCMVMLSDWDTTDDPFEKHIEESPDCLFAKLGKEEDDLTVEQFMDIMCSRALTLLDHDYEKFQRILNKKA